MHIMAQGRRHLIQNIIRLILFASILFLQYFLRIFSICAPQLYGRIIFAYLKRNCHFLHNNVLCNCVCSVTGVGMNYWGGGTKRSFFDILSEPIESGSLWGKYSQLPWLSSYSIIRPFSVSDRAIVLGNLHGLEKAWWHFVSTMVFSWVDKKEFFNSRATEWPSMMFSWVEQKLL